MKKIIINDTSEPRLDRYLKRVFPFLTQGNIEKLLRKKDIVLNGKKARSADRLQNGDELSYFARALGSDSQNSSSNNHETGLRATHSLKKHYSSNVISLANKILGEYLIFDCEHFIAIDKPCGLAAQGGSKISLSIADSLEYLNYIQKCQHSQSEDAEENIGIGSDDQDGYKIVHRLDKNTSGLFIIAKGYNNAAKLAKGFKDRIIKKEYIAFICGRPKQNRGEISGFIGKKKSFKQDQSEKFKNDFERVEELPESDKDAKFAQTEYKVIKTLPIKEAASLYPKLKDVSAPVVSLIEYKPQTGRMHQLRIHSKLLGCPIIGDVKYEGPTAARMMLHARKMTIPRDIFGTSYDIESKFEVID